MINRWSDKDAAAFLKQHSAPWGKDLALQSYASRLLGAEVDLVLYGGGNTSVKGSLSDVLGESIETLFIKPSGLHMASMIPGDFIALDQKYLWRLRKLRRLSDEAMAQEFRRHRLGPQDGLPSVETLLHAFVGHQFIDHTHPSAILALTNRTDGERVAREALGKDIAIVPYVTAGFALAIAVSKAIERNPHCKGAVLMQHGLITWGQTARGAYDRTIQIVGRAENYVAKRRSRPITARASVSPKEAQRRYVHVAPMLRGMLSIPSGNPDNPFHRIILKPLVDSEVLRILDSKIGKGLVVSPPLTPDYLIRTKAYPLFVDKPRFDGIATVGVANLAPLRDQLVRAIAAYASRYSAYIKKYAPGSTRGTATWDPLPRVVLMPGLGAVCIGRDTDQAAIAADITRQALGIKTAIYESGGKYRGVPEHHLFDMEFHSFQRAKLAETIRCPLTGGESPIAILPFTATP